MPGAPWRGGRVVPHRGRQHGTSTRWRITDITYNEAGRAAGLPATVFAKTFDGFKQRLVMGLADLVRAEPLFFTHIRPKLDIEAAHGYHAAFDLASGRAITLMEDLVETKGAEFSLSDTPISLDQMKDLLSAMAAWHGRFWNSAELETIGFNTPARRFVLADRFIQLEKRSAVGAQRAGDIIPVKVRADHDALYRAMERSLGIASEGPLTFLHGDSHVGNTYRTSAGRMGFTDWQVALRGTWAYDVAYLLSSGLTVKNRRAWEKDLLAFYLDRLAEAGGEPPEFEQAWPAYRSQMLYPYFIWLFTIGHGSYQPKYQSTEISLTVIERIARAIEDLDSPAAVSEAA